MSPRRTTQLRNFDYQGCHRYFLTLGVRKRQSLFTSGSAVAVVLDAARAAATAERFELIAYCVMPDHAHFLVGGAHVTSNLRRFVKAVKQASAYRLGSGCWQPGFYERVLRSEEATEAVCGYIWQNPVRAGIVATAEEYPYSGSDVFVFPAALFPRA